MLHMSAKLSGLTCTSNPITRLNCIPSSLGLLACCSGAAVMRQTESWQFAENFMNTCSWSAPLTVQSEALEKLWCQTARALHSYESTIQQHHRTVQCRLRNTGLREGLHPAVHPWPQIILVCLIKFQDSLDLLHWLFFITNLNFHNLGIICLGMCLWVLTTVGNTMG